MHLKGGVGKSTIAVNLAHAFKEYTTVALVDLDSQGSITDTKDQIKGIEVLPYSTDLKKLDYGAIFVDTPPYLSDKHESIFKQSDLILIPTKAGIYDVIAASKTVQLIKQYQKKKPELKVAFILNMVHATTTLTEVTKEQLNQYELPILKTQIVDRQNFVRSAVLEDGIYSTSDRKAKKEMDELTKEVLFLLQ